MLFRLKSEPADFIVYEELTLPEEKLEKGQYLYIFFEKTNKNTMDVLLQLCKSMGIMKKYVGVAWLKDKMAITRQWISLPCAAVDMVGGKNEVIAMLNLQEWVEVLDTKRCDEMLQVWWNDGNRFRLKLNAQKEISEEIKKIILTRCERISLHWCPNYYWMQRFGKWLKNLEIAKDVIDNWSFEPWQYISKFILQSYSNYYFNKYAALRREKEQYLLDWDIMVDGSHHNNTKVAYYLWDRKMQLIDRKAYEDIDENSLYHFVDEFKVSGSIEYFVDATWMPTWPLIGPKMLLPVQNSLSMLLEERTYSDLTFRDKKIKNCQYFGMKGRRRPLWLKPIGFEYRFEWDDLYLEFFLATWSYATVLVWAIFDWIDQDTMIHNKLIVPK